MEVRSLGYRTDLFFHRRDGVIVDRGEYLVVRTPSNPTYHWGNYLLFAAPPKPGDLAHWKALFAREVGPPEEVGHLAFGWDTTEGEAGDIEPFLADGFCREDSVVLTATQTHRPPKWNREAVLRTLTEDWEWEQAFQNLLAARPDIYSEEGYAAYLRPKMARNRAMAQAGLGAWFGAFVDGRMAASLGVFVQDGVGRFQTVGTHPDFRRRGLCGTLVHHAAEHARTHWGAHSLVMVADEHYHAARIYESVGFLPTERCVNVCWWQRDIV